MSSDNPGGHARHSASQTSVTCDSDWVSANLPSAAIDNAPEAQIHHHRATFSSGPPQPAPRPARKPHPRSAASARDRRMSPLAAPSPAVSPADTAAPRARNSTSRIASGSTTAASSPSALSITDCSHFCIATATSSSRVIRCPGAVATATITPQEAKWKSSTIV
jgi:hypothetical protein